MGNMLAKQQESPLSLKLLIDEKMNRVVAAEAEKDFVDILFSFLTFPMGTIIRVTSREPLKIPVTIGCMTNLYRSIQNSPVNWNTELCKTMVLNPRNSCAIYCSKLKMNIDDSESEKKYVCSGQGCPYYSKYQNVSCECSNGETTKEMKSGVIRALQGNLGLGCIDNLYTSVKDLDEKWFGSGAKDIILDPRIAQHHNCRKQPLKFPVRMESHYLIDPRNNNNFTVEPSLFIVSDDLEVNPLSFASSFQLLSEVKVSFSDIEEQVITVGTKEALSLLKAALINYIAIISSDQWLKHLLEEAESVVYIAATMKIWGLINL
ncbi:PREDICTED: uncharacterized protein LOC109181196 [Ipomoea nil]|uniref:uncharacterized protein LOC109181196 n=1 Tax=Ipomoea nil TaxID=35883 RepID=UPI000901A298|nr:PREDICTED: uncharacterized protein LOC109181196 [Ipomoea nil]